MGNRIVVTQTCTCTNCGVSESSSKESDRPILDMFFPEGWHHFLVKFREELYCRECSVIINKFVESDAIQAQHEIASSLDRKAMEARRLLRDMMEKAIDDGAESDEMKIRAKGRKS